MRPERIAHHRDEMGFLLNPHRVGTSCCGAFGVAREAWGVEATMADGRVLQHPIGVTHLGMPTGARWPRGPGSTVLSCPISLLGLKDANSGR